MSVSGLQTLLLSPPLRVFVVKQFFRPSVFPQTRCVARPAVVLFDPLTVQSKVMSFMQGFSDVLFPVVKEMRVIVGVMPLRRRDHGAVHF